MSPGADLTTIVPDWPAPGRVCAAVSTRSGGVSAGPYASLNLGLHVGDETAAVHENRARLRTRLGIPAEPVWLQQEHGVNVIRADLEPASRKADAAVTLTPGVVCALLTADCLPVMLCNRAGTCVGAAHAGWRGLVSGVVERTVAALGCPGEELLAWLGPAIGPEAFEVGDEVRARFVAAFPDAVTAFVQNASARWQADLYALARQRLAAAGVASVYGGGLCTHSDPARFFSYRRDGACGRMASLIWLA